MNRIGEQLKIGANAETLTPPSRRLTYHPHNRQLEHSKTGFQIETRRNYRAD